MIITLLRNPQISRDQRGARRGKRAKLHTSRTTTVTGEVTERRPLREAECPAVGCVAACVASARKPRKSAHDGASTQKKHGAGVWSNHHRNGLPEQLAKLVSPAGGTKARQARASARAHGLARRKSAQKENKRTGDKWGTRRGKRGKLHTNRTTTVTGEASERRPLRMAERPAVGCVAAYWPMREKTVSRRTKVRTHEQNQVRGSGATTKETDIRSSNSPTSQPGRRDNGRTSKNKCARARSRETQVGEKEKRENRR